MSDTRHTDEDRITDSDVETIQRRVAEANASTARAVSKMAAAVDNQILHRGLPDVHRALLAAHQDATQALDRVENTLRTSPVYTRDTPRDIIRAHAERLEETYDGPVLNLALQLLEYNRREYLHGKPETQGAEIVERHGLTGNQRKWLNRLQDAWDAYDGGEESDGE